MDLSIVIPIYNVAEKELERCFDSVNQIKNIRYECLLIDDGSKAETSAFCRRYAQTHAYFSYHRKNNGGVSSARNWGIRLALGEFLCFVDADDKILPDSYSTLSLLNKEYDLIFTDLVEINGPHQSVWRAFDKAGVISYDAAVERMVKNGKLNGPYGKLYKRSFLKKANVWFREEMIQGEDAVFFCEILRKTPKMLYCREISYFYFRSFANGNRRFQKNPVQCILDATQHYKALLNCIETVSFCEQRTKKMLTYQKRKYVDELFGRALDSVENNLLTVGIQSAIREGTAIVNTQTCGKTDMLSDIKVAILNKSNWGIIKHIEMLRMVYYKIRKIR